MDVEVTLGRNDGGVVTIPLSKAPHILVAGATGSGKSAWTNRLISDLIRQYPPGIISFLMIDPKRVELAPYRGVHHLQSPPAYTLDGARSLLYWAVREMNVRFSEMEAAGIRDIDDWNRSKPVIDGWSRYLVVIDELANLMLADKKIEKPIVQLASMGRAAGMHLLLATQRPSADVLTGLIRANVPTRICMPVVTSMDSRIVLDEPGAEKMLRAGSILARLPGHRQLQRLTGIYIEDDEIQQVVRANS